MRSSLIAALTILAVGATPSGHGPDEAVERTTVIASRTVRLVEAALPEFRRRHLDLDDYEVVVKEVAQEGRRTIVTFRGIEGRRVGPRLDLWVDIDPMTFKVRKAAFTR